MSSLISHSVSETEKFAAGWISDLSKSDVHKTKATLIGLSGHLGAGKTAFVKAVAKSLGITEDMTSPTFVIMKRYEISKNPKWKNLIHIDAYRLEKKEELDVLDFSTLMKDPANLIMVEWPENVSLESWGEDMRLEFEMNDGVCTIRVQ